MDGPHHVVYPTSISGPLGCFLLLATMNNAALNTRVQRPVQVHAFTSFGCTPRMELLEQMATLGLIFEEPPGCFPQQKYHFTFLPPMHKSSNFSTSVLGQHFFFFFNNSRFNGCEKWCLMVVLICASLMTRGIEQLFIIYPYHKENSNQDR